jgi:hypothetical protein
MLFTATTQQSGCGARDNLLLVLLESSENQRFSRLHDFGNEAIGSVAIISMYIEFCSFRRRLCVAIETWFPLVENVVFSKPSTFFVAFSKLAAPITM